MFGSLFRRFLIVLKRLAFAAVAAIALAFLTCSVFIGFECYRGSRAQTAAPVPAAGGELRGYARDEVNTFLTLPEWYIVYSAEEYARSLERQPPSAFPYFGSIRQYWRYYGAMCDATRASYPFNVGSHVTLGVIGTSFSIEYLLKGIYENTAGRLTEWLGGHATPEDRFAHATAVEYGTFLHTVPWYDFPFAGKLRRLWHDTPLWGRGPVRIWERKAALSAEYGIKAIYGWLIRLGTKSTFGDEDLRIYARIENAKPEIFAGGAIRKVSDLRPGAAIVTIPRYEAFTGHVLKLVDLGVRFIDIAGNDEILVTLLAPATWTTSDSVITVIVSEPILTEPAMHRVAVKVPVRSLHALIGALRKAGVTIEHLYDY
jgi:hypothetical protein